MRSRHGKCFPLLKITRFQGPLDLLILYKEITGHHSYNAFSLYLSQSDDISVLPLYIVSFKVCIYLVLLLSN